MTIKKTLEKMRKEISDSNDRIRDYIQSNMEVNSIAYNYTSENYKETIEMLNSIIQTLLNLKADYKDMECVVLASSKGKPIVIKNGEIISKDDMTSFNVFYDCDGSIEVNINYK